MTLSELHSIEDIKKLKARYCRYFDTKRWDDYFALFASDAIFDMRSAGSVGAVDHVADDSQAAPELEGYQVGRDNIAAHLMKIVADITSSIHFCHTPEIELTSADTATGIWTLDDWHQFHAGPLRSFHGFGHYEDTYIREGGKWFIQSTRLTRLRVDVEMA